MPQFDGIFFVLFIAAFCLSLVNLLFRIGFMIVRRVRKGPFFPPLSTVTVRFRETWTSGRSHRNFFNRLGGARNCLIVTVTEKELWVTVAFPFSLADPKGDLLKRISLSQIVEIKNEPKGWKPSVFVTFKEADGKTIKLQFYLRQPGAFLQALGCPPPLPPSAFDP